MTVEFILRPVQRGIAAPANIYAGFLVIHVLTGPWPFSTFMYQDILLKISKFIVFHGFLL